MLPVHLARKRVVLCCFPYLGQFSLNLLKHLNSLISSRYPQLDSKVIFYAQSRLSSLFNVKDKLQHSIHSNVVYRFSCSGCNATYIGKTKRHFATRIAEHLGISDRTPAFSAVRDHCEAYGHTFDSRNFDIISSARSDYELSTIFLPINAQSPIRAVSNKCAG